MSFISFNLTLKTSSLLRPHHHFFLSPHSSTRSLFSWPSSSSSSPSGGISDINNLKDGHSKRGDLLIYKETKRLPYTNQQLYEVIANVEAYPQFVPYCIGSNLLSYRSLNSKIDSSSSSTQNVHQNKKPWIQGKHLGESYMLESELVVGFKTFEERYTSHVECRKWDMVKASASHSALFKCLNSTWTFRPINELSSNVPNTPLTEVSLYLAFAFTSPLHAAIGELFWKKVSERMVLAFEGRLMEVYSKTPPPPSSRS
ncbi:hypothetical protein CROQUDRAFT_654563 [Cronartium quercuum f. sp. fusiforme G11]|uniref:Coenzyme Q-binding protein COQ10 START domain-containing protein n=1 Tax=Cronartium quercuum f. sp. fusiforme G11 TaxID=708437 RepID=A0A9P6NKJ5_9BASI|nr:hypothetical protein CROQUDRAFT_654563 [Cronartium quercuum f. sp. fusiforme G11]